MRKIQFASCIALCMVVPFLLNGCNDEPVDPVVSTENVTGLSLKLDAGADTAQIKLQIKEVACGSEQLNPAFYAEKVFDVSGPNHSIKDEFFVVEPGCYDVIALPYQADGITPSELCEPMGVNKVVVIDGDTTEIGLIGQCKGKEAGGLDVFVLFNIPPVITDLSFDPDKFVSYCSTQEICAEFFDPDGDKVELEWKQVSGIPLLSGPTPIPGSYSYDPFTGISKECVSLVHGGPGTVALEVKAFDLMKDADGNELRVDSLLKQLGYAPGSSDSLLFPSHGMASSNCPCVPNAFPEQCDLVDNDCDGQKNEDVVPACVCNPFEKLNCYTGPAGTEGVGLCRIGAYVCALDGSAFGADCVDEVLPSWEVCDGEDNDCDGLVDEGFQAICTKICNPGTIESCNNYTGPLGTEGVGTCKSGTRTCNATGVGWSACTNPVEPAAEICNDALDNDCNGLSDDGPSCSGGCGNGVCDSGETCNSCSADCGACPVLSCTNVCFESDGAGNYQASGSYDAYKTVINVAGDYEYWLCDPALGCSDYPNGCVYGGIHTGATNCPAAGTVESQACNGSTLELNYHDGSCCFYQDSQANAPACTGCMNPPPAGTLLNQSCQGYSLLGNFADGACGSYSASIEACSIVCGRPDAGTLVSSSCSGSNLVGTYNDGNCSTYTQVIEYSSAQCAVCGNGVCEAGENNANCAMDCPPVIVCGNGVCEAGESNANCPADCVPSAVCGNSYCEAGESKASCPGDCGGGGFCNICFESDAAGNYQASGPYDAYKNTLNANGDYEYWLCSNALGCSDYPGGCSYGGIHTGATNCPAWGSIESTACVGTTRHINFHNGDCCYYQGIEYNSPFCP